MIETKYELELNIVLENNFSYTNYMDERNITAFLTGFCGECSWGEDESSLYWEEEDYEFELRQVVSECCKEASTKTSKNSFSIYLNKPLEDFEKEILLKRINLFNTVYENKIILLEELTKTILTKKYSLFNHSSS